MSKALAKRGFNTQEAIEYLGVKRKAFEKYFKPYLKTMRFGTSIIFDVVDLDAVLEDYKRRNERLVQKGEIKWAENKVASTKTAEEDGVLVKSTVAQDFESVLKVLKRQRIG